LVFNFLIVKTNSLWVVSLFIRTAKKGKEIISWLIIKFYQLLVLLIIFNVWSRWNIYYKLRILYNSAPLLHIYSMYALFLNTCHLRYWHKSASIERLHFKALPCTMHFLLLDLKSCDITIKFDDFCDTLECQLKRAYFKL